MASLPFMGPVAQLAVLSLWLCLEQGVGWGRQGQGKLCSSEV